MLSKYKNIFKGDRTLWNTIFVLGGLSIVAVYSASGALAYHGQGGDTSYFLFRQILFIGLGLIGALVFQFVPYKFYFKYAPWIYVFSILLVILTFVVGKTINGATRWLEIPIVHIDFQPSEFAKIAIIIFVARILSVNQDDEQNMKKAILGILILTSIMLAFLIKSGFSTTVLIGVNVFVLLILGRVHWKYIFGLIAIAVLLLILAITVLENTSKDSRLSVWKGRWEDFKTHKDSYQAEQAKIAIVTGGVVGKGPGNSVQRNVLSQSNSDFIFASIVEEYGWIGAVSIISLYLWILFRGIYAVHYVKNTFPALLALGLIFSIATQAFLNMFVAVGLFPVTGQTLPFVSQGGTSNIITGITFGIILNISREAVIEMKKSTPEEHPITQETVYVE